MPASSLAAGLCVGIALLILGNVNFNIHADVGLNRISALWFVVGLPAAAFVVFTLLSPLSYWLYRVLSRDHTGSDHTTEAEEQHP